LPGQEYNLDVQYAPNECGQLRTAIGIVVVNDVEPKALNIIVKGKVIENNVLLTTLKGNLNIYELEGIDFGSVSFGQRACIPVKIANQNQVTHQWSIKVDEKVGKDKRALSEVLYVEPAEGVLKPGQSNILKFYFNPKQVISNVGFTSLKTRTDSKEYTLPIQLSVTQESCPEVTKMLRLKGTGVPFELEWSKKTVEFETTQNGKESVQTFTISNPSPVAYSFKFQKIVQFKLSPSHGLLGPNETVTIAVAFKPNQLGLFQCYASCQFSVQTHFGDGKIEQEIELDESSSLKGQIQLIGTYLPSKGTRF
jgi:hypothetical protein